VLKLLPCDKKAENCRRLASVHAGAIAYRCGIIRVSWSPGQLQLTQVVIGSCGDNQTITN